MLSIVPYIVFFVGLVSAVGFYFIGVHIGGCIMNHKKVSGRAKLLFVVFLAGSLVTVILHSYFIG